MQFGGDSSYVALRDNDAIDPEATYSINCTSTEGFVEKQGVKISLLFIATNSTAIEIFLKILKQFNSSPIRRAVIPFCFDSPSGESGPKNVASLHFSTGP